MKYFFQFYTNLIILFICLQTYDANNNSKTILLLGNVRSGKSCFVNSLFNNENLAQVGDDDGEPTTKEILKYEELISNYDSKIILIDTPGLDNTNKDLISLRNLTNYIVDNIEKIDLILFIYSMTQEDNILKNHLEKINFFFNITKNLEYKSVFIIPTKADDIPNYKKKIILNLKDYYNISYTNFIINSDCKSLKEETRQNIIDLLQNETYLNNNLTENLKLRLVEINKTITSETSTNETINATSIENLIINMFEDSKGSNTKNKMIDEKIEKDSSNTNIIYIICFAFTIVIFIFIKLKLNVKELNDNTDQLPSNQNSSENNSSNADQKNSDNGSDDKKIKAE